MRAMKDPSEDHTESMLERYSAIDLDQIKILLAGKDYENETK